MKTKIPFNAGDLVHVPSGYGSSSSYYFITGHVWWPVEEKNAYYILRANEYGELLSDTPEYIWNSAENWKLVEPKEKAA
jgi:hypothetical protein